MTDSKMKRCSDLIVRLVGYVYSYNIRERKGVAYAVNVVKRNDCLRILFSSPEPTPSTHRFPDLLPIPHPSPDTQNQRNQRSYNGQVYRINITLQPPSAPDIVGRKAATYSEQR